MTPRELYHARHGGTCIDCHQPTSARRKGHPSRRCAYCHQAYREPAHGTQSRYKHRKCRCAECRAANTAAERARRARAS